MKKYLLGGIVGFMLAFAVSAHAEVIGMIGKVVTGEYDLTINGQKMEYPAVMIDGTTYAPVRMLGEATGYIVKFDDTIGVKMVKKITISRETVNRSINAVNTALQTNNKMISLNEEQIEKLLKEPQTAQVLADIKAKQESIERIKNGNVELNDQIAKLNQTLADIAAQEAELNPPAPKEDTTATKP